MKKHQKQLLLCSVKKKLLKLFYFLIRFEMIFSKKKKK